MKRLVAGANKEIILNLFVFTNDNLNSFNFIAIVLIIIILQFIDIIIKDYPTTYIY